MRKIAALLSIALLISLAGCGGSAGVDDAPSSNIESQSPSLMPETPPEETQSATPTQAPSQIPEATQEPIASEEPEETIAPTVESTSPPESSAPVSTSDPSSAPTSTPTPVHTHNYTSTITKQATCAGEGVKTFTCSTCGNKYNETIAKTNDHDWITIHVDEYGYYEKGETHSVRFKQCDCGFTVNSDMPNATEIWDDHMIATMHSYITWREDVPNGEPKYVIVVPAHDEAYCSICGAIQ